ncbi:MAG: roadblock/LC7 domain-containing protein [Nanobdellota archaeon]
MGITKKEELNEVLHKLDSLGDVEGSAVITRDGLLVSSDFRTDTNAETFAAMSATMFGAAETAVSELNKGEVLRVITETKGYKLVAMGAGNTSVVVTLVNSDTNLGLILVELQKATEKVKSIME